MTTGAARRILNEKEHSERDEEAQVSQSMLREPVLKNLGVAVRVCSPVTHSTP